MIQNIFDFYYIQLFFNFKQRNFKQKDLKQKNLNRNNFTKRI